MCFRSIYALFKTHFVPPDTISHFNIIHIHPHFIYAGQKYPDKCQKRRTLKRYQILLPNNSQTSCTQSLNYDYSHVWFSTIGLFLYVCYVRIVCCLAFILWYRGTCLRSRKMWNRYRFNVYYGREWSYYQEGSNYFHYFFFLLYNPVFVYIHFGFDILWFLNFSQYTVLIENLKVC